MPEIYLHPVMLLWTGQGHAMQQRISSKKH